MDVEIRSPKGIEKDARNMWSVSWVQPAHKHYLISCDTYSHHTCFIASHPTNATTLFQQVEKASSIDHRATKRICPQDSLPTWDPSEVLWTIHLLCPKKNSPFWKKFFFFFFGWMWTIGRSGQTWLSSWWIYLHDPLKVGPARWMVLITEGLAMSCSPQVRVLM